MQHYTPPQARAYDEGAIAIAQHRFVRTSEVARVLLDNTAHTVQTSQRVPLSNTAHKAHLRNTYCLPLTALKTPNAGRTATSCYRDNLFPVAPGAGVFTMYDKKNIGRYQVHCFDIMQHWSHLSLEAINITHDTPVALNTDDILVEYAYLSVTSVRPGQSVITAPEACVLVSIKQTCQETGKRQAVSQSVSQGRP